MSTFILLSTLLPMAFAVGVYFGIQHGKNHPSHTTRKFVEAEVLTNKEK